MLSGLINIKNIIYIYIYIYIFFFFLMLLIYIKILTLVKFNKNVMKKIVDGHILILLMKII